MSLTIDPGFQKQIDAARIGLEGLKQSTQNRVLRNALAKGLRVVNKAIKNQIPNDWKEIRPLIGYRILKQVAGDVAGKTGVAVGKVSRARREKINRRAAAYKFGKAQGVGISPENVEWFILGTGPRYAGTKTVKDRGGKNRSILTGGNMGYRGIMPPQVPNAVKDGVNASYSTAVRKMTDSILADTEKEVAKLRAKIAAAMK